MNPGKVAKAMPEIVNATLKKVKRSGRGILPIPRPPARTSANGCTIAIFPNGTSFY